MPVSLNGIREKYSKKPDSIGIYRFPAGGKDVVLLCNTIENLEQIIRKIQHWITTAEQNKIEMNINRAFGLK